MLTIRRADLGPDGITFRQYKTDARLTVAWTPELREVVERAKGLSRNIIALTLLHNRRGKPPDYRTTKQMWDAARRAARIEHAWLHHIRGKSLTDAKRQGQDATALTATPPESR